MTNESENLKKNLMKFFKFSDFKTQLQENATDAVCQRRNDVFISMPTGSGKSICFQLPAVLQESRVAFVFSPLIALIKDQIDQLQKRGINAASLNSKMDKADRQQVINDLRSVKPSIKLLYITPELAATPLFQNILTIMVKFDKVSYIVVDEAHCVSEWGHNFRPDYQKLGYLRELFPDVPWVVLTATANKQIIEDVKIQLRLREPVLMFKTSCFRENLYYDVIFVDNLYDVAGHLKDFIQTCLEDVEDEELPPNKRGCGIVYCRTREETELVARQLTSMDVPTSPYHAGLKDHKRIEVQNAWMDGQLRVMAATVSFGMGIDKATVRFVVHWGIASSIPAYYQESGRAGRDGKPARCRIYYSKQARQTMEFVLQNQIFHAKSEISKEKALLALESFHKIVSYCETVKCRHSMFADFFDDEKLTCQSKCDVCCDRKVVVRALERFANSGTDGHPQSRLISSDVADNENLERNAEQNKSNGADEDTRRMSREDDLRKKKPNTEAEDEMNAESSFFRVADKGLSSKKREMVVTELQTILQKNYELCASNGTLSCDLSNERIIAAAVGFEHRVFSSSQGVTTYRNTMTKLITEVKNCNTSRNLSPMLKEIEHSGNDCKNMAYNRNSIIRASQLILPDTINQDATKNSRNTFVPASHLLRRGTHPSNTKKNRRNDGKTRFKRSPLRQLSIDSYFVKLKSGNNPENHKTSTLNSGDTTHDTQKVISDSVTRIIPNSPAASNVNCVEENECELNPADDGDRVIEERESNSSDYQTPTNVFTPDNTVAFTPGHLQTEEDRASHSTPIDVDSRHERCAEEKNYHSYSIVNEIRNDFDDEFESLDSSDQVALNGSIFDQENEMCDDSLFKLHDNDDVRDEKMSFFDDTCFLVPSLDVKKHRKLVRTNKKSTFTEDQNFTPFGQSTPTELPWQREDAAEVERSSGEEECVTNVRKKQKSFSSDKSWLSVRNRIHQRSSQLEVEGVQEKRDHRVGNSTEHQSNDKLQSIKRIKSNYLAPDKIARVRATSEQSDDGGPFFNFDNEKITDKSIPVFTSSNDLQNADEWKKNVPSWSKNLRTFTKSSLQETKKSKLSTRDEINEEKLSVAEDPGDENKSAGRHLPVLNGVNHISLGCKKNEGKLISACDDESLLFAGKQDWPSYKDLITLSSSVDRKATNEPSCGNENEEPAETDLRSTREILAHLLSSSALKSSIHSRQVAKRGSSVFPHEISECPKTVPKRRATEKRCDLTTNKNIDDPKLEESKQHLVEDGGGYRECTTNGKTPVDTKSKLGVRVKSILKPPRPANHGEHVVGDRNSSVRSNKSNSFSRTSPTRISHTVNASKLPKTRFTSFGRQPKFPRYVPMTLSTRTSTVARIKGYSNNLQPKSVFQYNVRTHQSTQTSPAATTLAHVNDAVPGKNEEAQTDARRSNTCSDFKKNSAVSSIRSLMAQARMFGRSNSVMEASNYVESEKVGGAQSICRRTSEIYSHPQPNSEIRPVLHSVNDHSNTANENNGSTSEPSRELSPLLRCSSRAQSRPPVPLRKADQFMLELSRLNKERREKCNEDDMTGRNRKDLPRVVDTSIDSRYEEVKYPASRHQRNSNRTVMNSEVKETQKDDKSDDRDPKLVYAHHMVMKHLKPFYRKAIRDKDTFMIIAQSLVRKIYDYVSCASEKDIATFVSKIVNRTIEMQKEDIPGLIDRIRFEYVRDSFF